MAKIQDMRIDYKDLNKTGIDDVNLISKDPYKWFQAWYQEAVDHDEVIKPAVMMLTTASSSNKPATRCLQMRSFDQTGLTFFSFLNSPKANDLMSNPYAAVSFYWEPLAKQIRLEGKAERLTSDEDLAAFQTWPREYQLSVHAGQQSTPMADDETTTENRITQLRDQYEDKEIPKPEYWGGYRFVPDQFEFWVGGSGRLHDRVRFRFPDPKESLDEQLTKAGDNGWVYERLSP